MGSFFRNTEEALLYSSWSVLGIYPSPQLGEFYMWIICNDTQYRITLEVPRVIHVATQETSENPEAKLVKKGLPQNRSVKYLYEYTMPESDY